jgi:hypothetical protein
MASSLQGLTLYSAPAGADLSAALFKFARVDTDGNLVVADGHTSGSVGIVVEGAKQTFPVTVQMDGISKVLVGTGGVTAGAPVESDTDGRAIAGVLDTDYDAVALATGVENDIVSVRLRT